MEKERVSQDYAAEVLDTCLKAGRLMIEGGSETYRVEDTMMRIARNAGITGARCFTTPTGIFMSLGEHSYTQVTQVKKRNINLELVDRVNELSREFATKKITLDELQNGLKQISISTVDLSSSYLSAIAAPPTIRMLCFPIFAFSISVAKSLRYISIFSLSKYGISTECATYCLLYVRNK